ncbi:hypothetical protein CNYM01_00782 [Colletotrichum nymphaeae SA-01]|uniref:Uncharacterized protein n=1 Tax=Colletotrichum nymphaeae SA-01 TaxID=1460502 RepID=A0A135TFK7_9PEZI|nr:hypothetical protein CNYM01_00782 [Colletotrichum nymphaeae SA-01]
MRLEDSDAIGQTAIVYQCRSSNTWADDMALTATHFPQSNLTYAVLFGCTAEAERNVFEANAFYCYGNNGVSSGHILRNIVLHVIL